VRLAATGDSDHPRIDALGFLDEAALADAYAAAHLALHPTRVDTDSMVINEALASGTPVVTSPLPTHTRTDEAVMHAATPEAVLDRVAALRAEVRDDPERYAARCALARHHGLARDAGLVYRRLRALLFPDWRPVDTDPRGAPRHGGRPPDGEVTRAGAGRVEGRTPADGSGSTR
jgi:hypothetical protein